MLFTGGVAGYLTAVGYTVKVCIINITVDRAHSFLGEKDKEREREGEREHVW